MIDLALAPPGDHRHRRLLRARNRGGASKSKSVEALRLSTVRSVGASASTATGTWDNRRRNVIANYPFEKSHRFVGIQPDFGHAGYSPYLWAQPN